MQKITPFLWFNDKAEEAMKFYTSIFKNSKAGRFTRNGDGGPGPKGAVMIASFRLFGQEFIALNGGPQFTFTPAISFVVNCETQEEIDEYWEKLSEGGEKQNCGWLKDKYGLSWQIVSTALGRLMKKANETQSKKIMEAVLKMNKLDIKILEQTFKQ